MTKTQTQTIPHSPTIGGMLTPFIINNYTGTRYYDHRLKRHVESKGICAIISNFNIIASNIELLNEYVKNTIRMPHNILTYVRGNIGTPIGKDVLEKMFKDWTNRIHDLYVDDMSNLKLLLGRCYQLALWSGHSSYKSTTPLTHNDDKYDSLLGNEVIISKNISSRIVPNIYSETLHALLTYIMLRYPGVLPNNTYHIVNNNEMSIIFTLMKRFPDHAYWISVNKRDVFDTIHEIFNEKMANAYFMLKRYCTDIEINLWEINLLHKQDDLFTIAKEFIKDKTEEELRKIVSELPEHPDMHMYKDSMEFNIEKQNFKNAFEEIVNLTQLLMHTMYFYYGNYFVLTHINLDMYDIDIIDGEYYIGKKIEHATHYDIFRESLCSNDETWYMNHKIFYEKDLKVFGSKELPDVLHNGKRYIYIPCEYIYTTFPFKIFKDANTQHYRKINIAHYDKSAQFYKDKPDVV